MIFFKFDVYVVFNSIMFNSVINYLFLPPYVCILFKFLFKYILNDS